MVQLRTSLVCIVFILFGAIDAQFNPEWCPDGPSPPGTDPKWSTIPTRFEIMTELVDNNEKKVIEISQAFSTTRDSIGKNLATTPEMFYWDFSTNEYFKVTTTIGTQQTKPECLRNIITDDLPTSTIEDTLYLKPSILLGFNPRNERDPLWGLRYEADEVLRDIPANVFKSCFYVSDINATVKVTYHVSDVTKFQAYLPVNESLILRLDVNMTSFGRHGAYTYNVFRYTPEPGRNHERQALETPSGVYCLNRTLGESVPSNIPERISVNAEAFLPTFNNSIVSSHNLYDSEFLFSRYDAWYPDPTGRSDWQHRTEMHDFGVGLSYQI